MNLTLFLLSSLIKKKQRDKSDSNSPKFFCTRLIKERKRKADSDVSSIFHLEQTFTMIFPTICKLNDLSRIHTVAHSEIFSRSFFESNYSQFRFSSLFRRCLFITLHSSCVEQSILFSSSSINTNSLYISISRRNFL